MILAAGRGERLRPLTDYLPKPLLQVGGETLAGRHLEALAAAGIRRVVINTAWRGKLLRAWLGDGRRWGVEIAYTDEGDAALETGGGIQHALPLLGDQPFIILNGDVWTDLDPATLPELRGGDLAHLVLVDNPVHNPAGDFALCDGRVRGEGARLTYSGVAVLAPQLLSNSMPGRFPLAPLLRDAIDAGVVSGCHFHGAWFDTGTAASLAQARDYARQK